MGRARGMSSNAAMAADPFADAFGARRGAINEHPLVSAAVSPVEARAAADEVWAQGLSAAMQAMHEHRRDLGRARGLLRLEELVVDSVLAPARQRVHDNWEPALSSAGLGAGVAHHIIRSNHVLHLSDAGLTGSPRDRWGLRIRFDCGAKQATFTGEAVLHGAWQRASTTEPEKVPRWEAAIGDSREVAASDMRCPECAQRAELFVECDFDAAPEPALPSEYVEYADAMARRHTRAAVRDVAQRRSRSLDLLRLGDAAGDGYASAVDDAVGMYFADHLPALEQLLGREHMTAYRARMRRSGLLGEEVDAKLRWMAERRLFDGFSSAHIGNPPDGLIQSRRILSHNIQLRDSVRRRIEREYPGST